MKPLWHAFLPIAIIFVLSVGSFYVGTLAIAPEVRVVEKFIPVEKPSPGIVLKEDAECPVCPVCHKETTTSERVKTQCVYSLVPGCKVIDAPRTR